MLLLDTFIKAKYSTCSFHELNNYDTREYRIKCYSFSSVLSNERTMCTWLTLHLYNIIMSDNLQGYHMATLCKIVMQILSWCLLSCSEFLGPLIGGLLTLFFTFQNSAVVSKNLHNDCWEFCYLYNDLCYLYSFLAKYYWQW